MNADIATLIARLSKPGPHESAKLRALRIDAVREIERTEAAFQGVMKDNAVLAAEIERLRVGLEQIAYIPYATTHVAEAKDIARKVLAGATLIKTAQMRGTGSGAPTGATVPEGDDSSIAKALTHSEPSVSSASGPEVISSQGLIDRHFDVFVTSPELGDVRIAKDLDRECAIARAKEQFKRFNEAAFVLDEDGGLVYSCAGKLRELRGP